MEDDKGQPQEPCGCAGDLQEKTARLTHKLRTPLAAIMGFAELLEDACRDDEDQSRQQLVHAIQRNAQKMQGLIQEL